MVIFMLKTMTIKYCAEKCLDHTDTPNSYKRISWSLLICTNLFKDLIFQRRKKKRKDRRYCLPGNRYSFPRTLSARATQRTCALM